jgi:dipeptidyl aminopeptidase/acylaminoacyl peptidase
MPPAVLAILLSRLLAGALALLGATMATVAAAGTVATAAAAAGPPARGRAAVPLIERERLFGDPVRTGGRVSPDGRWLSWLAPRDGVLNLWVAPFDAPDRARPLTDERDRPIRASAWSPDSRMLLFAADRDGDGDTRLLGVDIAGGPPRALTPPGHARLVATGRRARERVLVALDAPQGGRQQLWSLEPATGRLALVLPNDAAVADDAWLADEALVPRFARRTAADGSAQWHRVVDGRVTDEVVATIAPEDAFATRPLGLAADGRTLYWLAARGRDTAALQAEDLATGAWRTLAADPHADIEAVLLDPRSGRPQAWMGAAGTGGPTALEPAFARDLAALRRAAGPAGRLEITSRSDDDRRWVVAIDRVSAPLRTMLYDRGRRRLVPFYVGRAALAGAPLVPMRRLAIRARDGLPLAAYLSRPAGGGAAPLVLLVHGGPWEHDAYGYNSVHQWLANRGYAVLSVDFRGSTGFGRRFLDAGDGQWGRAMEDDLLDAVAWSVAHGVARPGRVAIMGASYGGYAALAGLAFSPGRFACGIDVAGPVDLAAMVEAVPESWTATRQQMRRRVGDPSTPAGRARLAAVSPLGAVDRLTAPLLVVAGANDPLVPVAASERLVAALAARGAPVTALVFPREGHGLARTGDNLAFLAIAENFLARCLGGRAQPVGDALRASDVQVRLDAARVPGLAQALARRAGGPGGSAGPAPVELRPAQADEPANPRHGQGRSDGFARGDAGTGDTAGSARRDPASHDPDGSRGSDPSDDEADGRARGDPGPPDADRRGPGAAPANEADGPARGDRRADGSDRPGQPDKRGSPAASAGTAAPVRGQPAGVVHSVEIRLRPPQSAGDGCAANQARASATSAAMPACSASRPP